MIVPTSEVRRNFVPRSGSLESGAERLASRGFKNAKSDYGKLETFPLLCKD